MTITPTLLEVLDLHAQNHLAEVNTAEPGCVVSYDQDTGLADIQPQIKTVYFDEDGGRQIEEKPLLVAVPIFQFRAGGFVIEMPVEAGDQVLIVYCADNIGQWHTEGTVSDPGDLTKHGLSGAVAIPGLYPKGKPSGQAKDKTLVIAGDGGVFIGDKGATEPLVLGNALKDWLSRVTFPTSFGPTGTAITAGSLPAVLSTRHKVDS